jgi:hypothetical protein
MITDCLLGVASTVSAFTRKAGNRRRNNPGKTGTDARGMPAHHLSAQQTDTGRG